MKRLSTIKETCTSGGGELSEIESRLDELEDKISEMQTNLNIC